PDAAPPACRVRRVHPGCVRASAARREGATTPRWPAHRRLRTRWPPRAASHPRLPAPAPSPRSDLYVVYLASPAVAPAAPLLALLGGTALTLHFLLLPARQLLQLLDHLVDGVVALLLLGALLHL